MAGNASCAETPALMPGLSTMMWRSSSGFRQERAVPPALADEGGMPIRFFDSTRASPQYSQYRVSRFPCRRTAAKATFPQAGIFSVALFSRSFQFRSATTARSEARRFVVSQSDTAQGNDPDCRRKNGCPSRHGARACSEENPSVQVARAFL